VRGLNKLVFFSCHNVSQFTSLAKGWQRF
jgi:hypothetical protein